MNMTKIPLLAIMKLGIMPQGYQNLIQDPIVETKLQALGWMQPWYKKIHEFDKTCNNSQMNRNEWLYDN